MTAVAPRPRRAERRAPRTRLDPFPRDAFLRWSLRFALAIPTLIAGWRAGAGSTYGLATPNQQLLDHVAAIEWTRADMAWVGEIFPPLSTLLAAIIPGGRAGLAVAGAFVAGIFLQKLFEAMVQRRFPWPTAIILLLALAANPLFAYTVTENFAAFLGLAFFGLGITDIVRFVAWRNTRSGFRAGIFLMLAVLSDLSGILYVLTAALAAPFLRLGRAGESGARFANVVVIVYPTVAALTSLVVLNLIFIGDPVGSLGNRLLDGTAERFASIPSIYSEPTGWLLAAPVLCAWLVALIVRRPGSILVSTLVFVAINAAYVLGTIQAGSSGNTFILMTLMAIALVPTARTRAQALLMDVVAVLQIAIAWTAALSREAVVAWMSSLADPFAILFG